ncbi:hypothetical protein [Cytobacillus praedii]|uniref:hypothetical protein n=1 Tax=Cytobacillus praedii TaxID=1742358 RepID=UPI002E1ED80A|nr:hypothetical protein [Cytobacillus praedii]
MAFHKQAILREPRKKRIIVCEDLNFFWDEPELKEVTKMWELGEDVRMIGRSFDRDPDEILFALIHLARRDRIQRREGGLLLEQQNI